MSKRFFAIISFMGVMALSLVLGAETAKTNSYVDANLTLVPSYAAEHLTQSRVLGEAAIVMPTIKSFTAQNTNPQPNTQQTLSWQVSSYDSLSLDVTDAKGTRRENVSYVGSILIYPSITTTYVLTVTNIFGSVSQSLVVTVAETTADTQAPTTPANHYVTVLSSSEANVFWTASTDNVAVAGYRVYINGTLAGTSTTTSYKVTNLLASTDYYAYIIAFDAAGNQSVRTSFYNFRTLGNSAVLPVPTGLTAIAVSPTQINVSWQPSGNGLVTGYKVYRNGVVASINNGIGNASYVDAFASANTTYTFSVASFDAANNLSPQSAAVMVTTPPVTSAAPVINSFIASPATSTAGSNVTLSFNVTNGTMLLIDNGVGTVTGQTSVIVKPTVTTTYTLTASNPLGTASKTVTVSVGSAGGVDTQPPTVPGNPIATALSSTEVNVTWTASTDNVGVVSYRVYTTVPNSSNNSFAGYNVSTTNSYKVTGLLPNTTYQFWVEAYDGRNLSASSALATATTLNTVVNSAPTISSFTAQNASIAPGSQTTLMFAASNATTLTIDNGVGIVTGQTSVIVKPATTTTYTLTAANTFGSVTKTVTVTVGTSNVDTVSPVILSVKLAPINGGMLVYWTTNEPSDSQVEYGTVLGYGQLTDLNSSLVTEHSAQLKFTSDVRAGTTYYFRVKSRDAAGNLGMSEQKNFVYQLENKNPIDPVAPTNTNPNPVTPTPTQPQTPPVSSGNVPKDLMPGDLVKFQNNPTVYLVRPEGLYPFSTMEMLNNYTQKTGERINISNQTAGSFSVQNKLASEVQSSTQKPTSFSTGTLVLDAGTIYFIYGPEKIPFSSMGVFEALGYARKNVVIGDTSMYRLSPDYILSNPEQAHPWGSWVKHLESVVYYVSPSGLIAAPTWEIFVSNGGQMSKILPMNKYDRLILQNNPNNEPLKAYDSRVVR